MALVTNQNIREFFALPEDFPDGAIDESILIASATVKKFVGADAYTDAGAETPDDAVAAAFIKAGEARTAVYFLLLNSGSSLRRGGIVKKETDGAGMGGTVHEFFSPDDIRKLRSQYAEEALSLLNEYKDTGAGVFVLDAGGIETGTMISTDLEPDLESAIYDVLAGRY